MDAAKNALSRAELREILLRIKERGPSHRNTGICFNVLKWIRRLHGECGRTDDYWTANSERLCVMWPESSGDSLFPVSVETLGDLSPILQYKQENDLWVGDYGAARYRLLDFLISSFESGEYDDYA